MPRYYFAHHTIVDSSAVGVSQMRWEALATAISAMKQAGWFTRGSSISGTAGTAFSASPDGVDRWAGRTWHQANTTGGAVWHALEHAGSGAQVCVFMAPGQPQLALAVARFETGGVWRNAVSATSRPADTASTPARNREVVQGGSPPLFLTPAFLGQTNRYHAAARDDGEAMYLVAESPAVPEGSYTVLFFHKLRTPNPGDTNPYIVSAGPPTGSDWFDQASSGTTFIQGVYTDGVGYQHQYCRIKAAGADLMAPGNTGVDPFSGKLRAVPLIVYSGNTPVRYFRGTAPDMLRVPDDWSARDTLNGRAYMTFGTFAFPWDGVTSLGGIDREVEFVAIDLEQTAGGGAGGGRAFWNGMENI